MKHLRTIEANERKFQLGDVISFDLIDGEPVEAMAVREESDGIVFCFVDCLKDERPMLRRGSNGKSYEESDLRKELNSEIIEQFPADLREMMIQFDNGDLLRIPTEKEIFGQDEYGDDEPESVEQWEPMKLRRNRIAFQGSNGALELYWLQNRVRDVASATNFAPVADDGRAAYNNASLSHGIRPVFKIKNL